MILKEVDDLCTDWILALIEVDYIFSNSTLMVEDFDLALVELIEESNLYFFVKVREFANTPEEELGPVIKLSGSIESNGKNLRIRKPALRGTSVASITGANDLGRDRHHTTLKANLMYFAIATDGSLKPQGESIYTRCADAVETSGCLVATIAKLTTGMKLGHDHFDAGLTGLLVDINWDASPVITNRNRAIGMQRYIDFCAVTCQNFIDRVINDLFKEVMQSTKTGVANIHSGALADSFKTFEHTKCICVVVIFYTLN